MNKENVIVFGATGAVGAYTTLHLIERGYNVYAVGKRKSDNGFFQENACHYFSVDILNESDFKKLPQSGIFGVVHLAGLLPANMQGYNPKKYIDVNIQGTLNILQYATSVGIKVFIYSTSFSDVCHLWNTTDPIPADVPATFPLNNDHSIYSISKNTGADIARHFSNRFGFKNFVLRFPNIYLYHPNMYFYVDGVKVRKGLFNVIEEAENGEDIELWGNPMRSRDMVYVKDCCQLIEKCLSSDSNGGTYNVGTGVGTSREEQIKGIIEVFGPKQLTGKILKRPQKGDSPQYIMDISKSIRDLNYRPKYFYIKSLRDLKHEREINRFKKLWGSEEEYNIKSNP